MAKTPSTDRFLELRGLSSFSDLTDATIRSLSNVAALRSYIPGRYIIIEGKPCRSAYLILQGRVNIFLTSVEGRKQVLARLGSENWFNVVPNLEPGGTNPANVVALTPVKAVAITGNHLRRLLQEHPQLTLVVLNDLANHYKHLSKVVEMLALLSTRGRVAYFILEHADKDGFVHWHCTQEDIAARLGTVQDVVGRVLRGFADEGLIEMPTRHCIVIRDREKLEIKAQR
jgi:CRP/FNR family transcriptional regulator